MGNCKLKFEKLENEIERTLEKIAGSIPDCTSVLLQGDHFECEKVTFTLGVSPRCWLLREFQ